MSILGNRVLRTEDDRFLRGRGTYVENLARAADAALSLADPDAQAEAVAAFLEVAQQEADFWQMTWSPPSSGGEGTAIPSTP